MENHLRYLSYGNSPRLRYIGWCTTSSMRCTLIPGILHDLIYYVNFCYYQGFGYLGSCMILMRSAFFKACCFFGMFFALTSGMTNQQVQTSLRAVNTRRFRVESLRIYGESFLFKDGGFSTLWGLYGLPVQDCVGDCVGVI